MALTQAVFLALPPEQQLTLVWLEGTFLARRWGKGVGVNLYHLGSFFCEVYYDTATNVVVRSQTFTTAAYLAHYLPQISLRDLEET